MERVNIRPARVQDERPIGGLIRSELGYPASAMEGLGGRLERMLNSADYAVFVAELGGEVVGFIGLHSGIALEIPGGRLSVIALAVSQARQRQGIGGLLLDRAERYAAENGIELIALTSNRRRRDAHKFYERHGFEVTSFGFKKGLSGQEGGMRT